MAAAAAGPVDCHCHLAAPCFQTDVAAVVRAAEQAAVSALVVVSEQAGEFRSVVALAERFPAFVLPCLGVHPIQGVSPEEQRSVTLKDLDAALPLIELYKDKLVGIGEVGLDFTPRFASTDEQKEGQRQVLTKQIELARRLDLPLNVHSRSAGRPTINLLKEQGATKVLLHAFDGKPSVAMEGVKAGYYFSIPPSIIRSEQKQKLVKLLPLESMCLETDSPALGPEKQVRNEPKNIYIAAEYIAKIKGIPVEEVIEVTTQNALKVFPKLRNCLRVQNRASYQPMVRAFGFKIWERVLYVSARVVGAIYYPGSTGTISTKLGEGQSLPPDGAREQAVHDVIEKSRKAGVRSSVPITEQENELERVTGLAERKVLLEINIPKDGIVLTVPHQNQPDFISPRPAQL